MTRVPVNLYLEEQAAGIRRTEQADTATSNGGLVDSVRPDSPAAAAGLRPGARVLAANGRVLRDVVDYQFYTAEPLVRLRVREPEGGERDYVFEKWPDDDLGLGFAEATWDGVRICTNTCPFCFLKGLPRGMRRTLYIKDDDYRLSFLHGNFVTLSNLTEADWQRLEEQRLSPLHVSVHATELGLRRRLLGYAEAPDIIEQLRRLASLRIQAHTQVVLCPGVNDGEHLDRTIADLGALYPAVQSVAVVPVGATMQFEQRMSMVGKAGDETQACSPAYTRRLVRQITAWQRRFQRGHGASIVHAADEYHLIAGARIPAARWYDGFPQYENGIGMTRSLLDGWHRTRRRLGTCPPAPAGPLPPAPSPKGEGEPSGAAVTDSAPLPFRDVGPAGDSVRPRSGHLATSSLLPFKKEEGPVGHWCAARTGLATGSPLPCREGGLGGLGLTVACGALIAPTLARLFAELDALAGTATRVVPICNAHFGARINVSGLLVARDIIAALAGRDLGDAVLLPRTALDYFGRKFLDDGTPAEVERALGVPLLFASGMAEAVEQLQALVAGRRAGAPAIPGVTNGIFWAEHSPAPV